MTDDPNNRQNAPADRREETRQQQQGRHSGQPKRNTDDNYLKHISRGGTDSEQAREEQDQGGQRRAS
jgi:hypothetical protein